LPHPLVVAALDHVMDCGQMTAQAGISSMTLYRVGMVAGIRELARSLDLWNGPESALGEQCELMLEEWHHAAQDIAIDRDLRRPRVVVREASA